MKKKNWNEEKCFSSRINVLFRLLVVGKWGLNIYNPHMFKVLVLIILVVSHDFFGSLCDKD